MNNQEAIEILKIERNHMMPTLFTERIEAMDMAISALEKQIQKKPKNEPDDSALHYKHCPLCHRILTMYDWKMPFCAGCGQAIDWTEGE